MTETSEHFFNLKKLDLIESALYKSIWILKKDCSFVVFLSLLTTLAYSLAFYLPHLIIETTFFNIVVSIFSWVMVTVILNIQRIKYYSVLTSHSLNFIKLLQSSFSKEDLLSLKDTIKNNFILGFFVVFGMGTLFVIFGIYACSEEKWNESFFSSLFVSGTSIGLMLAYVMIRLYIIFYEYYLIIAEYYEINDLKIRVKNIFKAIQMFLWLSLKILIMLFIFKLPAFIFIHIEPLHLLLMGIGTTLSMCFLSSVGWSLKNHPLHLPNHN